LLSIVPAKTMLAVPSLSGAPFGFQLLAKLQLRLPPFARSPSQVWAWTCGGEEQGEVQDEDAGVFMAGQSWFALSGDVPERK